MKTPFLKKFPRWSVYVILFVVLFGIAAWGDINRQENHNKLVVAQQQLDEVRKNLDCLDRRYYDCEVVSDDAQEAQEFRLQKAVYDSLRQGAIDLNWVRFIMSAPLYCDPYSNCCLQELDDGGDNV